VEDGRWGRGRLELELPSFGESPSSVRLLTTTSNPRTLLLFSSIFFYITWMASSTSTLPFQCKWAYCTDRFAEKGVLRAHVQTHIHAEKFIEVENLDVEMRDGQWYAREKESQGFGELAFLLG